jgi:hypothetical protein
LATPIAGPYIGGMAKMYTKSWLPKRSTASSGGRFTTVKETSQAPRIFTTQASRDVATGQFRGSVSGRIDLPNGQFITTVRKDVMDRALGRGEFEKK